MSSLIATKVKTNMCLDSLKLFIVHNILCSTVQTYATYTTLVLSAYNLLVSNTLISFCFQATIRYPANNPFIGANLYS